MLLRSSSTPVLGSLLSSIPESPSNNSSHHSHAYEASPIIKHHPPTSFPHTRLSFQMSAGSLHRRNVSCSSTPASGISSHGSFRRAQSEDNLQGLVLDSSYEEFYTPDQHRKLSSRNKCFTLQTIPSFSYNSSSARYEEEDEESDMEEGEEETSEFQEGTRAANTNMVLNKEVRSMTKMANCDEGRALQLASQEMLFAIGVGTDSSICDGGGGGGGGRRRGEFNHGGGGGGGGESNSVEEFYKKMVEDNPGNPLFLRNYAQFLYESKRELPRAEEYYSRAILADPNDGEILSQYAKIVWELHQDEGRALRYHERAVQAAPQDSHVHAAYASFLWETDEDGDECDFPAIPQLQGAMASA